MEVWLDILKFFISTSTIISAIVYLAKKTIEYLSKTGIEKFKNDLEQNTELSKAEILRQNFEHNVKFSKLHEERANVIVLIYRKLCDLEISIKNTISILSVNENTDNQRKITKELLFDFYKSFLENEIFFNDSVGTQIRQLCDSLYIRQECISIMAEIDYLRSEANLNTSDYDYLIMKDKIVEIKSEIRKEFKIILGVE